MGLEITRILTECAQKAPTHSTIVQQTPHASLLLRFQQHLINVQLRSSTKQSSKNPKLIGRRIKALSGLDECIEDSGGLVQVNNGCLLLGSIYTGVGQYHSISCVDIRVVLPQLWSFLAWYIHHIGFKWYQYWVRSLLPSLRFCTTFDDVFMQTRFANVLCTKIY